MKAVEKVVLTVVRKVGKMAVKMVDKMEHKWAD